MLLTCVLCLVQEGVPLLNVYTTYFYFGSAFFGVAFLLNIIFL